MRVEPQIESMDEDEEIGHITPMETNGVNADYIVVEEMSRTPGNVTCVTPDHSAETKQAAGNAAKDDSGSDTEVTSEPRILLPAPTHKSLGLSKDVETRQTPKQTEEPTQSLAVPHLALAWANVCCSWADISPRLEESNDWFWFLVSTIYLDLVAKPDCRGDVESVLKNFWYDMRAEIVVFHNLYEKELKRDGSVSRADRESMVSRAQEAYWTQSGQWFQYRAAWEILERHKDWEGILKPLLLGLDEGTAVNNASSSKLAGSTRQKSTGNHDDEEKSGQSGEPVPVPVDVTSDSPGVSSHPDYRQEVNPGNRSPPSPESWIETVTKQTSSTMSAGWLELNTQLLEMQVMTRSEDGLSPEALEYLRLRRQQILQKTRMHMHLSK
ncbi:hypothetical protein PI125_g3416 [Phytophthora idaei]|nr:hypothetical protein PI125_g3416 [Phytophthora idaei]